MITYIFIKFQFFLPFKLCNLLIISSVELKVTLTIEKKFSNLFLAYDSLGEKKLSCLRAFFYQFDVFVC